MPDTHVWKTAPSCRFWIRSRHLDMTAACRLRSRIVSIHAVNAEASTAESIRFRARVTATRFRTRSFAIADQAA